METKAAVVGTLRMGWGFQAGSTCKVRTDDWSSLSSLLASLARRRAAVPMPGMSSSSRQPAYPLPRPLHFRLAR